MESSIPVSAKSERRWRSKPLQTSKPSLVLAFFSCFAWLYVAGRLWQDAENRTLLSNLLKRNTAQRPKFLTVEDKLVVLGCKDLERRIVEAEMELTLAKSQGYLKNRLSENGSSSGKKFLAVIGVYTGFGSHLKRKVFRGSWMPRGDALKKLEERGVVIRFVIGRSANRGDSLDRNIDGENRSTKDFLILVGHEEAQEELPKKVKYFFSTAVQTWDAEFYVKVDDNINLDLEGLIELLEHRRRQDSAYIGCMKSGEVVTEEGKPWYEPEWWKFGDEKSYFRHASGSLLILSKNLAQYIDINSLDDDKNSRVNTRLNTLTTLADIRAKLRNWKPSSPHRTMVSELYVNWTEVTQHTFLKLMRNIASLRSYAHDDISVGSWMMGVQATYIDDNRLCCSSIKQGKHFLRCLLTETRFVPWLDQRDRLPFHIYRSNLLFKVCLMAH
ncbi:hypothetical protein POTOM_026461 [Populus tomentosa]|uniref:Hexosyltransferase n=1 Tax=Populus tomentosa TaxID=118781 RepID=A0A8X8CYA5_POPTO|nr:hypothetical protein POTOM_026461 [Populus tomentosa]